MFLRLPRLLILLLLLLLLEKGDNGVVDSFSFPSSTTISSWEGSGGGWRKRPSSTPLPINISSSKLGQELYKMDSKSSRDNLQLSR